jgi:hypothetical protein
VPVPGADGYRIADSCLAQNIPFAQFGCNSRSVGRSNIIFPNRLYLSSATWPNRRGNTILRYIRGGERTPLLGPCLDERLLVITKLFLGESAPFPNFVQRYHSLGWHLLKTDWNPDRVTISTTTGIRRHLRRNALTFCILCLTRMVLMAKRA